MTDSTLQAPLVHPSSETVVALRRTADHLVGHWASGPLDHSDTISVQDAITKGISGDPVTGARQDVRILYTDVLFAVSVEVGCWEVGSFLDVFEWEEQPGRTEEEVVAAFRAAADRMADRLTS